MGKKGKEIKVACPKCNYPLKNKMSRCPNCLTWAKDFHKITPSEEQDYKRYRDPEMEMLDNPETESKQELHGHNAEMQRLDGGYPYGKEGHVDATPSFAGLDISKYTKRQNSIALGLLISVIGFFVARWGFNLLYWFPLGMTVVAFVLIGLPFIGAMVVMIGRYQWGGNIMVAGSVPQIPIGGIGIFGGVIAWKLHELEQAIKTGHPPVPDDLRKEVASPSHFVWCLGITLIVLSLISPAVFYVWYMSNPQPKIDSVGPHYSRNYGGYFELTLLNVGNKDANKDKIEIVFKIGGEEIKKSWCEDVVAHEKEECSISISYSDYQDFYELQVFYDGRKTHSTSYF